MKKLILTIITLSIITYTGCYDPDTATVRINLGNMPVAHHEPKSFIDRVLGIFEKDAWAQEAPANIEKVHIIVQKNGSIITSQSFLTGDIQNNTVELNIPAGNDITIAVLGEYIVTMVANLDYISYQGSVTVDLKAGESRNIPIETSDISDKIGFIINLTATPAVASWNAIYGSSEYLLEYAEDGSTFIPLYQGTNTTKEIDYSGEGVYRLTVLFDHIQLKSDTFTAM